MKNSRNYLLPVILSLVLSLGLWLGSVYAPTGFTSMVSTGGQKYQKLQDIIQILDKKYVDTINSEALFEKTISDMLHELDPHSNYIPAKDMVAMKESIEGKFGGIGVRFFILRDTICITNVIPNSPSSRADVKAGDKILQVDGKPVAGKKITNEKVMGMLKGIENTSVSVKLFRQGQVLNKRIIRGSIPIESIVAAYMIDKNVGFIKIDQFSVGTADEFRKAALLLKNQGMKKLILDLRNNGGGVLTAATDIADEFLPSGVPIVVTKGEHVGTYTYRATAQGILEKTALTVLINSNSASASEILAGAIQDNDRGKIIGRRSFGKGLVQEDLSLRDGSTLRLTVARYYTPTGRCIQKPYDEGYDEYVQDQINRYESNEMYAPDTTKFNDSLKFKTPKGNIVYGGGGIMPDIFVPLDTTNNSWYFSDLRFSQSFNAFAFDFVQHQRGKWSNVNQFMKEFSVSDKMLNDFVQFAAKDMKVPVDKSGLNKSKNIIKQTLTAEIARQLWLEDGYYQVMNRYDNEVQRALKYLSF